MLVQFSVTNYRSIHGTAILSMKAAAGSDMKDCLIIAGNRRLLPVSALYGANSAGKTNILRALSFMRDMVCGSLSQPLKGEKPPQEPFAFTDAENQPTTFGVIFYYDNIRYSYGFSFDKKQILEEYLYYWPNGRKALIFTRDHGEYHFQKNVKEQRALAGRTNDNRLYMTSSNEWNCPQTEKAFQWFLEKLRYHSASDTDPEAALAALRQGDTGRQAIIDELMLADLGICDIILPGDGSPVQTVHRVRDANGETGTYSLPLDEESLGTQKYLSGIVFFMDALESGSVLLIDEIESSMHPLLSRRLVRFMQDPTINRSHAQLLFTTHDVALLDLGFLRGDQVWFVEKDDLTMETDLYSLSDFPPRKDENAAMGYLEGRYGAIPFLP